MFCTASNHPRHVRSQRASKPHGPGVCQSPRSAKTLEEDIRLYQGISKKKKKLKLWVFAKKRDKPETMIDNSPSVKRKPHGPPEGLGRMMAEYIERMTEVRMAAEFSDYAAWAHEEMQTDDMQAALWRQPPPTTDADWQVIERQLALDGSKLDIHRRMATKGVTRYGVGSVPPLGA